MIQQHNVVPSIRLFQGDEDFSLRTTGSVNLEMAATAALCTVPELAPQQHRPREHEILRSSQDSDLTSEAHSRLPKILAGGALPAVETRWAREGGSVTRVRVLTVLSAQSSAVIQHLLVERSAARQAALSRSVRHASP